jgi:hypothetical protein
VIVPRRPTRIWFPLQAAALLMHGFALAHQGRAREMERYLGAAEALVPDDSDLRAGAWGIGRALNALLAEDRDGARLALTRARQEAPDQHARILNPYEGPELLLRALAGQAARREIDAAAVGIVRAARWPELWFRAAQAVASGVGGNGVGASAALAAALDAGSRYPVFSALVKRLVAEAAIRDHWGSPGELLRSADATFTQLRLGRASAACRALLKAAGQPAPRRRAAEAGLPAWLVASGVTAREAGDAIIDQPDRMYHVCYRTGTGFTVIDIWADEQSFAAFGETLGPAIQRAGLDARPAVYPVEQVMTQDGTRTA